MTALTSSPAAWVRSGYCSPKSLATAGCGRIVLCSRAVPSDLAQETLELIRAIGCDVVVVRGDIAHPETAERLVAAAIATGLPLRGVLHAAGNHRKRQPWPASPTSYSTGEWDPKVHGAWHLHQASCGSHGTGSARSLRHGLLGWPGLGAHAAANSWLDAFTHWRRAQGLTATSIAWQAEADRQTASAITRRGGRPRVGGAAAPRPRPHRLHHRHRHPVADGAGAAQPVRRTIPTQRPKPSRAQVNSAPR